MKWGLACIIWESDALSVSGHSPWYPWIYRLAVINIYDTHMNMSMSIHQMDRWMDTCMLSTSVFRPGLVCIQCSWAWVSLAVGPRGSEDYCSMAAGWIALNAGQWTTCIILPSAMHKSKPLLWPLWIYTWQEGPLVCFRPGESSLIKKTPYHDGRTMILSILWPSLPFQP